MQGEGFGRASEITFGHVEVISPWSTHITLLLKQGFAWFLRSDFIPQKSEITHQNSDSGRLENPVSESPNRISLARNRISAGQRNPISQTTKK